MDIIKARIFTILLVVLFITMDSSEGIRYNTFEECKTHCENLCGCVWFTWFKNTFECYPKCKTGWYCKDDKFAISGKAKTNYYLEEMSFEGLPECEQAGRPVGRLVKRRCSTKSQPFVKETVKFCKVFKKKMKNIGINIIY